MSKPDAWELVLMLARRYCGNCNQNPEDPQKAVGATCKECPIQKSMEAQR